MHISDQQKRKSRGYSLDVYARIARSTDMRSQKIDNQTNRERVEVLDLPALFANAIRHITHFALKAAHKKHKKKRFMINCSDCSARAVDTIFSCS